MRKTDYVRSLPRDVLENMLTTHGTLLGVVKHICGSRNETIRRIINQRIAKENIQRPHITIKRFRYTPEQVKEAFSTAICWSDVYRALKVSVCDHNKRGIIRFAEHHGIQVPTFTREMICTAHRRGKNEWTEEEIFAEGSTYARQSLRGAAIKYKIAEYICSDCGCEPIHNGKELKLELDHINGVSDDNRKSNLRWLCPNCHSQTHTFKGKNK